MDARRKRAALGPVIALLVLGTPLVAGAQTLRDSFWHPDGIVQAIAYGNNLVYLGGAFQHMGAPTGGASLIDPTNGMPLPPFLNVAGPVYAVIPDGTGGWFLGGYFFGVQGKPCTCLAHVDASGKVASWFPLAGGSSPVTCLALSGSILYFGGPGTFFSSSAPRSYLAAVTTDTGTMVPFTPTLDGSVNALRVAGGTLYVGGQFHSVDGQIRNLGAAFDERFRTLSSWDPNLSGMPGASVDAIEVQSGRVYLGGSFDGAGLAFSPRLAAVDATNGQTVFPMPAVSGADVKTIVATQQTTSPFTQTIWIAGDFTQVGSSIRHYLAAIDPATTGVLPFNPNPNNVVRALGIATDASGNATAIDAGGDFTTVGGALINYFASLTPAGTATPLAAQPNNAVYALALASSSLVAGGSFTSILVPRGRLAAVDATSGALTPFNPGGLGGIVTALSLYGNSLYIGSHEPFGVGSLNRYALAEVNTVTGAVTPWNPPVDSSACSTFGDCRGFVNSIVREGNVVYIGGSFFAVGGQARHNLAAVDAVTGQALPFNVNPDSTVNCLLMKHSDAPPHDPQVLYAGGQFMLVNQGLFGSNMGQARPGVAALDPVTGQATSWTVTNVSGTPIVSSLARAAGSPFASPDLFLGGSDNNTPFLAAIDEATGVPNNSLSASGAPGTLVNALLYSTGSLLAGGSFGGPIPRLMGVDFSSSSSWTYRGWTPSPNQTVLAIAQNGTTVFVGGSFTQIAGSTMHPYFAAIGDGTVTGVPIEATVQAPSVLRAEPNPFHRDTEVRFALSQSEPVHAGVYDVSGRLVRDLHEGLMGAGEHQLSWSGQDDAGQEAARGIYFLRVDAGSLHRSAKVLLLR